MRRALWLGLLPLLLGAPARASVFDFLPEALRGAGGAMARMPGDGSPDRQRKVLLNGFPLTIQVGRSQRPVGAVLDHYAARYKNGVLSDLVGKPTSLRRERPDGGTLVSVEVPDRQTAVKLGKMEVPLLQAGPLRMVQARRNGLFTDYLLIWTDSAVPAEVLGGADATADAPGQDPPGVPRPAGRRSFSFSEPAAGYLMTIYEVSAPPEVALRSVSARIAGGGYQEDTGFGAAAAKQGKRVARFTQGQKDVVVTVRPGSGGTTQVVYLTRDLS